ncbi:MAG: biotin/lipoyl-binding protein, partial [Alphaproteobacteria bacterium]|nr:biotin/lipoyl-binding protein [Alphaproteobacteria bacterium]
DFQKVKAGDLLVEIVDDDYRAALEQAEANVAASEAAIQSIEQQKVLQAALIEQPEAAIEGAQADVTRYHLETVRQQKLLAGGLAGTLQVVEQAIDNEQRAKASLELDRAQLQQRRQQLNVLVPRPSRRARISGPRRRRGTSRRSTSATPASSRRSTAWSDSG